LNDITVENNQLKQSNQIHQLKIVDNTYQMDTLTKKINTIKDLENALEKSIQKRILTQEANEQMR
jgi:hypothetical protein